MKTATVPNAITRAEFERVYVEELQRAVRERPDEYCWPIENATAVAGRMVSAIFSGSRCWSKDSHAIKAACKRLGIKHTYKAMLQAFGLVTARLS